jgi:hypothetical protein
MDIEVWFNAVNTSVLQTSATVNSGDDAFLSTGVARKNIEEISFVNYLPSGTQCSDVSEARDDSIRACVKGGTVITVGSDYKMVANPDSSYLFAFLAYGSASVLHDINISGMGNVDWSGVIDMSYMFFQFGEYTDEVNIDEFPSGFGVAATNMAAMFSGFENISSPIFSLPAAFPQGFGSNALNVSSMFTGFGTSSQVPKLTIPAFPSGFGTKATNVSAMFDCFGESTAATTITIPAFPANFGAKATDMRWMFQNLGRDSKNLKTINIDWSLTNLNNLSLDGVLRANMFYWFANGSTGIGSTGAVMNVKDAANIGWFETNPSDTAWQANYPRFIFSSTRQRA